MSNDGPSQLPDRAGPAAVPVTALEGEVLPPKVRLRLEDAAADRKPAPSYRMRLGTIAAAGFGLLAICGAVAAGTYAVAGAGHHTAETAVALDRLQDDLGKLKAGVDTLHPAASDMAKQEEAVRALKKSVDSLKAELDTLKSNNSAQMAQLATKLDKADPTTKIADVMAKIDKVDHDPAPKLAEITARLDRIEKQVSSPMTTGSITPPPPAKPIAPNLIQAPPASPQAEKSAAQKPSTLGNWVLRDVYDGIALVEARAGGIREVAPGEFLPGAGEVRSIERRGRAWIVVTSRGIIDNETW